MINVTKTFLPPLEEYTEILKRAWDNSWITNRGELVLELEEKIKNLLQVPYLTITNNGTIPLQIALKLLADKPEVITTPFSYVATTSSILWENLKPVFVDIEDNYLTIDPKQIENAITENTSCILATHVFGNPCDVEAIQKIADKHHLKVIYDAAHCFMVNYKGKSIFNYGDISTCSFHATKIFHTGEGGAVFCNDEKLNHKIFYSHNFGHNGPLDFHGLGINGKISELQGAMGLAVFPYMKEIISRRKKAVEFYISNLNFSKLKTIMIREGTEWNYSYFPVIFDSEKTLLSVVKTLNDSKIFPRRYFYPSLNTLNFLQSGPMMNSESISKRIICLPLHTDLSELDLTAICKTINKSLD